jgi:hypothetical protein
VSSVIIPPQQASSTESNQRLKMIEGWVAFLKTPVGIAALTSLFVTLTTAYNQWRGNGQITGIDPKAAVQVVAPPTSLDDILAKEEARLSKMKDLLALKQQLEKQLFGDPSTVPTIPPASFMPAQAPPQPVQPKIPALPVVKDSRAGKLVLLIFDNGKSPVTQALLERVLYWDDVVKDGHQYRFIDTGNPQAAQWQPYYSRTSLPSLVILNGDDPTNFKWMATVPLPKSVDDFNLVFRTYCNKGG